MLHGKIHWFYQRLTAILILPLLFWLIFSLSLIPEVTFENMVDWVSKTHNFIFLSMLIVFSSSHFKLGIQVILEDYIYNISTRNFYIKFINFFYYILVFIGLLSVSKIYFGVSL